MADYAFLRASSDRAWVLVNAAYELLHMQGNKRDKFVDR
jgi:hypothetical protein